MNRSGAERLAAALLWLYPSGFRRQFGPDVLQFVRTATACASNPREGRALAWTIVRDAIRSLPREWRAALLSVTVNPRLQERRSGEPMRNVFHDLRHATRLLVKSPAFTSAAVLTLALGIGANTAIFTLADAVLLRPVRVHKPHELVMWSWSSSYPDFQEYTKRTDTFDGVTAVSGAGRVNLVVDGTAELVPSMFVSGNAFDVLGVRAVRGRPILPSDDVANGPIVAVLGYDYWQGRFGGDQAVIGRVVQANGRPVTIVGIAQKGFRGVTLSSNPSLYMPTGVYNQVQTGFFSRVNALTARGFVWLHVIGRLKPGIPRAQAEDAMTALYGQLHPAKDDKPRERVVLTPLPERAIGRAVKPVTTFVKLLIAIVGITLLIGCTNLANLLLARAAARRREVGVRMALGASRGRVVRQMLTESALLASAGGAASVGVAALAIKALSTYELPGGIVIRNLELEINGAALLATFGLALLTGLLFGALPAWRASRTDVLVSLRDSSRGATARSSLRATLVAAQVAMCLVLLAGTGLFARTLQAALSTPLGFDANRLISASVNVGLARYDEGRAQAFYADALARVTSLPQVDSAAWAGMVPTRGSWVNQVTIEPTPGGKVAAHVNMSHVGPGYFRTLGTRVLSGREFSAADGPSAPAVAVINEAAARKFWGGADPLRGRIRLGDVSASVIGVVENVVDGALDAEPVPFVYLAFNQSLSGPESIATDRAHLFVRGRVAPPDALRLVGEQLRAIDPAVPIFDLEPFAERVSALLMTQHLGFTLFALFSAVALGLATVGIYGVASYLAALRTREIGVRIALGASAGAVRHMMLVQGSRPVAVGIAVGLAAALYFSRMVETFLFGVSPFDPVTFATVPTLLAGIALAASYLPARRASRIEPVTALRED